MLLFTLLDMAGKSYKVAKFQMSFKTRYKIKSPEDAYKLFKDLCELNTIDALEEFIIILTSKKDRLLGLYNISFLRNKESVFISKAILSTALTIDANKVILAHNKSGGQIETSELDISISTRLKVCATVLGTDIIDYMLINEAGYYSFKDNGLL